MIVLSYAEKKTTTITINYITLEIRSPSALYLRGIYIHIAIPLLLLRLFDSFECVRMRGMQ